MKLHSYSFAEDKMARLVALGCRVLLPFHHFSGNSRKAQATLVQSYMRVVFHIPQTREYMWTGYPSEPILSQAAGQLLNDRPEPFMELAPEILSRAFKDNLLDHDELAELIAQVLLTIAHDRVIMKDNEPLPPWFHPFHSPIRLLDLLERLFSQEVWQAVRSAMALEAHGGDAKLEDRFDKAWISFSHFGELGDEASLKLEMFLAASLRGMGIKPSQGGAFLNLAVPVVFADSDSAATAHIMEGRVSIFQIHVRNRDKAEMDYASIASSLLMEVPDHLPVLSMIMDFGVEQGEDGSVVKVESTAKGSERSESTDLVRRHYMITAYGCTSRTYGCITEKSKVYGTLLAAQKPLDGACKLKAKFFLSDTLNNVF
jgi:hypothetical protein